MKQVIKFSGEIENFSPKKIYSTVREAGGSIKLARGAVKVIRNAYYPNITTQEILKILLKYLKIERGVSERYDLKRAIMSLGPSGFPFETFFSRVLNNYGYSTEVGRKLKGKKIMHEIDIIALKSSKKWMIECKYHNSGGTLTRLHPAMYTYARFLDLKNQGFSGSWLATNTKCSKDALEYSIGVNQKVTSWNYPRGESLLELIERKKIYPITLLKILTEKEKQALYASNLVILRDLLEKDVFWLSKMMEVKEERVKKILEEAKIILKIK